MTDWRGHIVKAQRRTDDVTNQGSNQGLFAAFIEGATGVTQTGSFVYAGGKRDIALPMPYDSGSSWIRAIPESGSLVLAGYRADIQDPICINYFNPSPKKRLDDYAQGLSLYRPLQPGEIEINSVGGGQTFYAVRPVVEHKAGLVRSWLNQDTLEAGAKAPLHTRLLWEHRSAPLVPVPDLTGAFMGTTSTGVPPTFNILGDEERFGAVKRPAVNTNPTVKQSIAASLAKKIAAATATADVTTASQLSILAAQLSIPTALGLSLNASSYPVPSFSVPLAGANEAFAATVNSPLAIATAASATAAASVSGVNSQGSFLPRVFAKEYVRIIKNPLYFPDLQLNNKEFLTAFPDPTLASLQNAKLIDIREGQVFDDIGNQVLSSIKTRNYLRASYKYFTPTPGVTKFDIDELGNVDWSLSTDALQGWHVLIPTGGLQIKATGILGTSLTTTTLSIQAINPIPNLGAISLSSTGNLTVTNGIGFSHTVTTSDHTTTIAAGNHSLTASGTSTLSAASGITLTSTTSIDASAPRISLSAPTISLTTPAVPTATDFMVLGLKLQGWLTTLTNALTAAAPIGNLGSPVLFSSDPKLAAALGTLSASIADLTSKTFLMSPT